MGLEREHPRQQNCWAGIETDLWISLNSETAREKYRIPRVLETGKAHGNTGQRRR